MLSDFSESTEGKDWTFLLHSCPGHPYFEIFNCRSQRCMPIAEHANWPDIKEIYIRMWGRGVAFPFIESTPKYGDFAGFLVYQGEQVVHTLYG